MRYFSKLGRLIKLKNLITSLSSRIEISQVVNGDLPIFVQFYTFTSGSLTLVERVIINALIKKYNPKVIFEIGTFDGRTALNMAANSPEEAVVYSLYLPRISSTLMHYPSTLYIGYSSISQHRALN